MKRRTFLASIPALILAGPVTTTKESEIEFYGALQPLTPPRRRLFARAYSQYKGISKGRKAHLWKFLEMQIGSLVPHVQNKDGVREGDCVGQAAGLGVDVLAACDMHMRFEPEMWKAKSSVEMIYAGARNEIGEGKLNGAPGCYSKWAVDYLQQYGVLHRIPYVVGDFVLDLSGYHPSRSKSYRDIGVPDELENVAREHPVKEYTKILDWRSAFDALYMGQPILVASSYAFHDTRDKDGFVKPYLGGQQWHKRFGRRGYWVYYRKRWYHCMLLAGFKDDHRPGGLIINSWGADWIDGPKTFGQPEGSFWVDAEYLDLLFNEWGSCFAMSAYVGHPQKMLNHKLY
jgi:hypothetical protein